MKKKCLVLFITTSLFFVGCLVTTKKNYATTNTAQSQSKLTITPGNLRFNSSSTIDFGQISQTVNNGNSANATELEPKFYFESSPTLAVSDLRGNDAGYYVTAHFSDLTLATGTDVFPTTNIQISVANEAAGYVDSSGSTGVYTPALTGSGGFVSAYGSGVAPVVLSAAAGDEDARSLHVSGPINAKIFYNRTDILGSGQYNGTVEYVLTDAAQQP